MGPVPLPGGPLGLGHADARLPLPAVDGGQGDRRRPVDPQLRARHRERRRHRREDPLQPPDRARRVVERGRALHRHRAPHGQRRDRRGHVRLPPGLQRLLPLRRGLHAPLRGQRALRRADHPPAVLARGPRLRRQARRRHRQRRDRDHARPGADRQGRARDDAAALAQLRPVDSGGGPDRQRAAARPARAVRLRHHALEERRRHLADLPAQPPPPGACQEADPQGAAAPASGRLRGRHALQTALQPVGRAAVHRARRRPLPRHPSRPRLDRHRPDRALHRDRSAAGIRRFARGRRRDHGHGVSTSSPSAASRSRSTGARWCSRSPWPTRD